MKDQCLGVPDISQVGNKADIFDQDLPGLDAPFNAEREDRPESSIQIFPGDLMRGMVGQSGIRDPGHPVVALEKPCHLQSVFAMPGWSIARQKRSNGYTESPF